jgi:ATP-dependent RNA helicase DeaD
MNVKALHGDMSQGSRDGVMLGFKGGRVPILVATDVAARGLDISTVTHVVNFDVPTSPDVYVHRIGRTGRVGRSGRAITFVEPRQKKELAAIEEHIGMSISPWIEGAKVAPSKIEAKPSATPSRRSRATATSRSGRSSPPAAAPTASRSPTWSARSPRRPASDGEAVREVRVLERFALLDVPAAELERIVDSLRDRRLEVEPARN